MNKTVENLWIFSSNFQINFDWFQVEQIFLRLLCASEWLISWQFCNPQHSCVVLSKRSSGSISDKYPSATFITLQILFQICGQSGGQTGEFWRTVRLDSSWICKWELIFEKKSLLWWTLFLYNDEVFISSAPTSRFYLSRFSFSWLISRKFWNDHNLSNNLLKTHTVRIRGVKYNMLKNTV